MSDDEVELADPEAENQENKEEENKEESEDGDSEPHPCGCCFGFILFPLCLAALAYNEQRYVCGGKAVDYTFNQRKDAKCIGAVPDKGNIFFSCEVDRDSLQSFAVSDFTGFGGFDSDPNETWTGMGSTKRTDIYACTSSESRRRAKVTYKKEWLSAVAWTKPRKCSTAKSSCGPAACNAPSTEYKPFVQIKWASLVKSGMYILPKKLLAERTGALDRETQKTIYSDPKCDSVSPSLGCVRHSFLSYSSLYISFLGEYGENGELKEVDVPGSWGCGAEKFWKGWGSDAPLKPAEFKKTLESDAQTRVWLVRFFGAMLAVCSISLILSPIAQAAEFIGNLADNIPLCGECIGDAIVGVAFEVVCMISCLVGCACSLFVISITWLVLRPLYGGIGLAVVCCCCAGGVAVARNAEKKKKKKPTPSSDADNQMPGAPDQQNMPPGGLTSAAPQYGQPQYGQPQYGQPQYGQPQYGQPQYGQPQHGQPQYGQPPPSHGQNPPLAQPMLN